MSDDNKMLPMGTTRRGFIGGFAIAGTASFLGVAVPLQLTATRALATESADALAVEGKDGLRVLNDRPLNAETPAHLLDDPVTPTTRHFIRNNGLEPLEVDAGAWKLTIDGLVDTPLDLSIADLRSNYDVVTMALVIECGGNGRAFFDPPASGNQWTVGAVGCSEWTGVRLKDVLESAGVKDNVVYTAHYGADQHLSGDPDKLPISRGLPIEKAMTDNILIAFEQNGEPLHIHNGAPLRLVVPGWPGSCSQKWLTRIELRDVVHDGPKMTGTSYRVPSYPVAAGQEVPTEDFVIIERMPVKSLITFPADSAETALSSEVRGHAWSGDRAISSVSVSVDHGTTWVDAELDQPANSGAWQNWRATVDLPKAGYYEIWARATDDAGDSQPFAIAWNPKGYLNNSMHHVSVRAV